MNIIHLAGNIGKDPELVSVRDTFKTSVSIATTDSRKKQDGTYEKITDWHNVEFWGKQAEVICKYVKKGSKLCVSGKLKTDKYEKDGKTIYRTYVRGENFELMDKSDADHSAPDQKEPDNSLEPAGDDLPF